MNKKFTSYMDAAKHCVRRNIPLTRIYSRGLYEFRIMRAGA